MSDKLYNLTNAKLSEVFAVEVAGWTHDKDLSRPWRKTREGEWTNESPTFAADVNAVLPWLEKCAPVEIVFLGDNPAKHEHEWLFIPKSATGWVVSFYTTPHAKRELVIAPTLARAICIALIIIMRAKQQPPKQQGV